MIGGLWTKWVDFLTGTPDPSPPRDEAWCSCGERFPTVRDAQIHALDQAHVVRMVGSGTRIRGEFK